VEGDPAKGTYNLTHYLFSNVGLHPDFCCNGFLNPLELRKVVVEQLKWSAYFNCKDEQRAQRVQGRRGWRVCQIIRPHDTQFRLYSNNAETSPMC